jgi:hypothetical protein
VPIPYAQEAAEITSCTVVNSGVSVEHSVAEEGWFIRVTATGPEVALTDEVFAGSQDCERDSTKTYVNIRGIGPVLRVEMWGATSLCSYDIVAVNTTVTITNTQPTTELRISGNLNRPGSGRSVFTNLHLTGAGTGEEVVNCNRLYTPRKPADGGVLSAMVEDYGYRLRLRYPVQTMELSSSTPVCIAG